MNINVEQFVLIILMVFLLYFVMNKCSCNIEGLQSCPKTKVKSCVGNFGNCDNLFTADIVEGGFHRCEYASVGGYSLTFLPDSLRDKVPCEPKDIGGDCIISNPCSVYDKCVGGVEVLQVPENWLGLRGKFEEKNIPWDTVSEYKIFAKIYTYLPGNGVFGEHNIPDSVQFSVYGGHVDYESNMNVSWGSTHDEANDRILHDVYHEGVIFDKMKEIYDKLKINDILGVTYLDGSTFNYDYLAMFSGPRKQNTPTPNIIFFTSSDNYHPSELTSSDTVWQKSDSYTSDGDEPAIEFIAVEN